MSAHAVEVIVPRTGSVSLLTGVLAVAGCVHRLPPPAPVVPRCGEPLDGPSATSGVAVIGYGRHLYLFGGVGPSAGASRFDVDAGQWEALPDLPLARFDLGIAVAGDRIVLGGAGGPGDRDSPMLLVFEPGTCSWSTGPEVPWRAEHPALAAQGSRVYVLGGETWFTTDGEADSCTVADFASVDLEGGAVTSLPPAELTRKHAAAVVMSGSVWVVGGTETLPYAEAPDNILGTWVGAVERFDLAAGAWGEVLDYPRHGEADAVVVGERIVSFTRTLGGTSRVHVFDPATGDHRRGADPADFEVVEGAGVIGGEIYVLASARHRPAQVWRYDLAADAWSLVWPR